MTMPENTPGSALDVDSVPAVSWVSPSGAPAQTLAAGNEPPDAPRATSRRRPAWRVVAVLMVLVVALSGAGVVTWLHWTDNLASIHATQQQAYRVARTQLAAARCSAAAPYLRLASGRRSVDPLRAQALRGLKDCSDYERVIRQGAGPAEMLIAYTAFLAQPRTEGLATPVRTAARQILAQGPPSVFTSSVCDTLSQLRTTKILDVVGTDRAAPRLYSQCLARWDRQKDTRRVAAGMALFRAEVTAAKGKNTVPLEPFGRIRALTGAPGLSVGLAITNTSPAHVEVTVVGLTAVSATTVVLPPCNVQTCEAGKGLACQSDAVTVVALKPGPYVLLTRALPGDAHWGSADTSTRRATLAAGRGYLMCLA